ncbi:hypothetical protein FQA39_LY09031 [Lamprigera yunnana]|nr:hypothetical protein FQA39_LY09031 [Lamprigera yunnana]
MWLIVLAVLVVLIYFYVIKPMNYWKEKNVVYEPGLPIVGNNLKTILRIISNSEMIDRIYKKFPNERYVGMFPFNKPMLLIKDPKLIKRMTVKEFETFPEHSSFIDTDVDPL